MEWIRDILQKRHAENLYRQLHPASNRSKGKIIFAGKEYIDFSSNDYLGLSGHPELIKASIEATEKYGTSSSASRLLSGDLELHHHLEEETAKFKGKESALVFNSGYHANIGIISSICNKDDVIFSDKLNHASIIDGIILSRAKYFRFNHNDTEHLEYLLKKERNKYKKGLIITETVFSMEGDRPPLKDIVFLKEKYNCILMVDEAHSTGIFGEDRAGVVSEEGLNSQVDIIMGTYGKALGGFGAYVASSKELVLFLINVCRSFIYTTALPASVIGVNIRALKLVREEKERAEVLLRNAEYLRNKIGKNVRGHSQIVPFVVGDSDLAIEKSKVLQKNGFFVLPIRPPTVPVNESRLRFSLCYYHNKEYLDKLLDVINK